MSGTFPLVFSAPVSGAPNLTATGSTQADALPLTRDVNVFTVVPAGSGAVLPSSYSPGAQITVLNRGSNNLLVYPPLGDQIEGNGINTPITVIWDSQTTFVSFDAPLTPSPRTWWLTDAATSRQVIDGGAIDNTPIGSMTPSTGAFTTLGATGTTTLGNGSANYLTISGAASGSGPTITAAGNDTNVFVRAVPKGTGKFEALRASFGTANGSASLFDGTTPLYVENNPTFSGSAWGSTATFVSYLGGTTTATGQPQVALFQVAGDSLEATAANSIAYLAVYGTFGATKAPRIGMDISLQTTAALNDPAGNGNFHQGLSVNMNTAFPLGGTSISYGGNWLGGFFQSSLATGAQYVNALGGMEIDIGAATTTSVAFKHGLSVILLSNDAVDSSNGPSTGVVLGLQSTATGNTASPGFMYGIAFGGKEGWWPINTTSGTMIMADPNRLNNGSSSGPAIAAATGIDFSAVTFSTAFLKSNGFLVDGSGNTTTHNLTVTGQTINLPSGQVNVLTAPNNAENKFVLWNNFAGTNAISTMELATGTANSYVLNQLHDNNGSPYLQHLTGSSVTGVYYDSPQHIFRDVSANTKLTIGATDVTAAVPVVLPSYTVATLPTGMPTGARAIVTDATSPTFLGALTGGGAVKCPVFYNGSAWVAG